jgi:hypothetical protein
MMSQPVQRIEKLSALLVGIATLLSLGFRDSRVTLGVALGGAVATLNFWALRRILQGIIQGRNPRRQAILGLLLTLKLGAVAGLILLAVSYLPIHPIALLAGISVVVLAIFIEGFRTVLRPAATDPHQLGPAIDHEQP